MKVSVVGTGYVGLVTGICLAKIGHKVSCIDIDEAKVESLKSGKASIFEPGLEELLVEAIDEEKLSFTTSLQDGARDADIIFLALPTPAMEDGSADLEYILAVANDLGPILGKYTVVVNKSTVPVGTAGKVKAAISKKYKGEFDVVSNPEFLKEGFAVNDFMKPDRIVIGTTSEKAKKLMTDLYSPIVTRPDQLIYMDELSSEMTKYAANSFLATKISFINEIANLCEQVGADIDHVKLGIGSDDRIGRRFLNPGIGYGGSCFPKDVKALRHTGKSNNSILNILEAVEKVNAEQKKTILKKLESYYKDLSGKKIAIWGLAFKPNTDDIREAPSLEIIKSLMEEGANVKAYDPEAMSNIEKYFNNPEKLKLVEDKYEALNDADALIIVTEWNEFKQADFDVVAKLMKKPVIFDGRNIYNLKDLEGRGIYYSSVGRRVVK